jgi:hypothetical protein
MRSILVCHLVMTAMWPMASSAQTVLRGRLLSEGGEPISGATISLAGIGFSVRSDSSGRFALSGQPGATLQLYFTASGHRRDSASVVLGRRVVEREFTLVTDDAPLPEVNPSAKVLRGRVVDDSGTPLSYANVQLNFGQRVLADDSGRFQLPHLSGSATLLVRRIGFEPTDLQLTSMPDTAVRIVMKPIAVPLKGVVVTGASSFRSLDTYGFYRRMKDAERGIARGYFITPEDIDKRKPTWITQMVQDLPSIRVCRRVSIICLDGDPKGAVILGPEGCLMTVYLDNIRVIGSRTRRAEDPINLLALPTSVAGIEVYPRSVSAPPQYLSMNGTCGVVLIWTK